MPSLRTKYTCSWDDGETVELLTTVQDLINAVDRVAASGTNNNIAMNVAIIYAALERLGYDPKPYDEWINLLDNYNEVKVVTGIEGPTQLAPLPTVPSPSPVSPVPTGAPGSTKTRGRSKPQSST